MLPINPDVSTKPLISVENLCKSYSLGSNTGEPINSQVLFDICLDINPGEFVAIMGHSGSGKSTLMNILGCLDTPTIGHYWLDGTDVAKASGDDLSVIRNRKIGFVFQGFNLLARTTAIENVELPMLYAGLGGKARRARAMTALEAVGLGDRIHHRPTELSGGQQQRVAIARALVTEPAIILADEPTGNLDSRSSEEVMAIFQQLHELGNTTVSYTHLRAHETRHDLVCRLL